MNNSKRFPLKAGTRFGRLTTTGEFRRTEKREILWQCICDCGNTTEVPRSRLATANTRSCGCLHKEQLAEMAKARADQMSLIGQKFERLTVIKEAPRNPQHNKPTRMWECLCDCGKTAIVTTVRLRNGTTRSCGCIRSKHGLYKHPVRRTWNNMIQRCTNPNNSSWEDYGGRGITVCDRWREFQNFIDDMGVPEKGLTIERKDVNGSYCIENCEWVPASQQARNTRRNKSVEWNGKTQCLAQWGEELGMDARILGQRIRSGWPVEKALTTPIQSRWNHPEWAEFSRNSKNQRSL